MAADKEQEFSKLVADLEAGFARMAKVFKKMQGGEAQESFARLSKVTKAMRRSLHEYRVNLGLVEEKGEDQEEAEDDEKE